SGPPTACSTRSDSWSPGDGRPTAVPWRVAWPDPAGSTRPRGGKPGFPLRLSPGNPGALVRELVRVEGRQLGQPGAIGIHQPNFGDGAPGLGYEGHLAAVGGRARVADRNRGRRREAGAGGEGAGRGLS